MGLEEYVVTYRVVDGAGGICCDLEGGRWGWRNML